MFAREILPLDDTHTWHLMYQVYPIHHGAEPTQDKIPVYDIPLMDERGRHITDFVSGQDMAAWVTQGPIAKRELEKLGESDKGIMGNRSGMSAEGTESLLPWPLFWVSGTFVTPSRSLSMATRSSDLTTSPCK
jgi:hypothetical protein